jgi:hypothetical protein
MNGQRHLRLVPPAPPPRPRRIEVRIVVSSARMPIGRSRPFRLNDHNLQELIDTARRLESRT